MDSGNSGSLSLQSSGGGDDEFDSRCGGDSSPLSELLQQQPLSTPSSGVLTGFGGGGSFYGVIQELATPPMSHAAHWSSSLMSSPASLPSCTIGGGGAPPSLPPSPSCQQGVVVSAAGSQQNQEAAAPPRGSRKRSRASRRAPTTVLTTDTSNFRAMVQEFTGIPAPPFARSRFDHLYPSRSGSAGTPLAPYLLRPFARNKLQASPYPPFNSPANKSGIIATSTTAPSATAAPATSGSYQHASAPSNVALGVQVQDHSNGGGGGYHPFHRSTIIGAQLDRNSAARYPAARAHPTSMLDAHAHGVVSSSSEATRMNRDLGRGDDELYGLVGANGRSVPIPDGGCNNTTTSPGAVPAASSRAGPLLGRNTQSATTTAAMRAQAGVESWICSTSE